MQIPLSFMQNLSALIVLSDIEKGLPAAVMQGIPASKGAGVAKGAGVGSLILHLLV